MTAQLGIDCKAYYNLGTYESPNWSEIRYIRDATLNQAVAEVDVTSRFAQGSKEYIQGLFDYGFEFDMRWKPANAAFSALRSAFHGKTPVELMILDGPVDSAGSQGLRGTFAVFNFSRAEQMEEGVVVNVTMKPTEADNPPAWVTMSA